MLIEFKVTNFRSIREPQTLSLVASNADKELPDCLIERDLPGLAGVKFLKGVAIYGANASGKSNILQAYYFLATFVGNSATEIQPGATTGTEPFKLDPASASKPSEFEVVFVAEGVRYLFGLSLTQQQILEEYLIAYPKGNPQKWYHRKFNPKNATYEWARSSAAFKADKSLQEKTRDNSLFLSVGPQFNHLQLTIVSNWFKLKIPYNSNQKINSKFIENLIARDNYHERALRLLCSADTGVAGLKIQKREVTNDDLRRNFSPSPLAQISKLALEKITNVFTINFSHEAASVDPVLLDYYREESTGTRRFFGLISFWVDMLDNGDTVFIDEIETSLHPALVRELLKLLFSKEHNPKGAQVIFTTHNPVLLDNTLMRRDQIWFTEKTDAGTTHLYPLTDYQPRKDEAIAKGYLAGRYGAIPYIPEGLQL